MAADRFDALTRILSQPRTRRGALAALAGLAGIGAGAASRKRKKKQRVCRNCCRADRSACRKKSATCRPGNCARFAITASWDSDLDHDTYLFVPNDEGQSLPSPFIETSCTIGEPDDYPFARVNQDAEGPGDEVTTILRLLPGTYEYWLELARGAPAGDIVVTVRDRGRLVLTIASPANPRGEENVSSWHVFDVGGSSGAVTEIDEVVADNLPRAAHVPNTFIFC